MKSPIQFSHETRVYVFRGKKLAAPDPGSYDAARWTPPSHRVFSVRIESDGLWSIELHGSRIASGDCSKRSRDAAKQLILTHCKNLLE